MGPHHHPENHHHTANHHTHHHTHYNHPENHHYNHHYNHPEYHHTLDHPENHHHHPRTQSGREDGHSVIGLWPRPTPATRGVTVCLRFMTDSSSGDLFTLAPRSPLTLSFSSSQRYLLTSNHYSSIYLNPSIYAWPLVRIHSWTSVCVVQDSLKRVVQMFQDERMSIRKIQYSRMVWSGEPVVDISGFDGQVTDLEVWDYPLQYREVFYYMSYGSRGTVLTWSNIAYQPRGSGILLENSYNFQQISSSEAQEQRCKYRKMCSRKRLFL
uniref:Pentraxin (PTX) domain-containing protein n=1 Tax=Knipowitschia caucasica TaxID=637954 RepID=A0AAV2MLN0_KNICA